jgi:hypothetical protein
VALVCKFGEEGRKLVPKLQAIDDALSGLRGLECTEERDAANERKIAEKALQSLRVIAPRFETLD